MEKLIAAHAAAPTDANRIKLERYLDKHIMAVCMASPDQLAYLRAAGIKF
jgi:hypothetical protein